MVAISVRSAFTSVLISTMSVLISTCSRRAMTPASKVGDAVFQAAHGRGVYRPVHGCR